MNRSEIKKKGTKAMTIHNSMLAMIEAAESGDLEAQHNVGACYATGDWDGPKDEAEAIKWYTRAAEAGHRMSQYDLGYMLIQGEGAEKDIEKGLWWMEQAAERRDIYAARVLSDIYGKGLFGVEQDAEKAEYWNEKSGSFKDGI